MHVLLRLTKNEILPPRRILIEDKFLAVEPNQIHRAGTVGKAGYESLRSPLLGGLVTHDAPPKLDEGYPVAVSGHDTLELAHGVDTTAIHIPIREIMEQVVVGRHVDLLFEDLGAPRPDSGQIHDVLFV